MDALVAMEALLAEWERAGGLQIHGSPEIIASFTRQEFANARETIRRLQEERFGKAGEIRLGAAMAGAWGAGRTRLLIEEAHKLGKIDGLSAQLMQIGVDTAPFTPPTSPLWGMDRLMRDAFGRGLKISDYPEHSRQRLR